MLDTLGVSADGRVATFCWNTGRHLELYFAAPCTGRVLHALNIRLFPEQLVYIANHAAGRGGLRRPVAAAGLFWPLVDKLETVRHVVVIDDGADAEIPDDPRVHDYEELLAAAEPFDGRFPIDDENRAAAMCYTSGTTGNPKGVVYSHRSRGAALAGHADRRRLRADRAGRGACRWCRCSTPTPGACPTAA